MCSKKQNSMVLWFVNCKKKSHCVLLIEVNCFGVFQVIKGLLKLWPKTCSQKEVGKISGFREAGLYLSSIFVDHCFKYIFYNPCTVYNYFCLARLSVHSLNDGHITWITWQTCMCASEILGEESSNIFKARGWHCFHGQINSNGRYITNNLNHWSNSMEMKSLIPVGFLGGPKFEPQSQSEFPRHLPKIDWKISQP